MIPLWKVRLGVDIRWPMEPREIIEGGFEFVGGGIFWKWIELPFVPFIGLSILFSSTIDDHIFDFKVDSVEWDVDERYFVIWCHDKWAARSKRSFEDYPDELAEWKADGFITDHELAEIEQAKELQQ